MPRKKKVEIVAKEVKEAVDKLVTKKRGRPKKAVRDTLPAAPDLPEPKQSDIIWDMIKGLPINAYGLAGQRVCDHVKKIEMEPSALYVRLKASGIITPLEDALYNFKLTDKEKKFEVEQSAEFVIIRLVPR